MYSIIGGGICGLTTALAFEKLGIEYQLYEKAKELIPVGAGILLPPNALQVFDWLGIYNDLIAKSSLMKRITLTKPDFSPLFDYIQDDVKEKYGFYSISIHRWELQNILLKKIPKNKIHLGKSFLSFKQVEDKIEVLFDDETVVKTNYIIGADGINSKVRKQLFPNSKIRYSGQTCWRGVCEYESISKEYKHRGIEMWGNQIRFGITKIEKNKFYWFAVVLSSQNEKDIPGIVKEKLSRIFINFHPVVRDLINKTLEKDIVRSDLKDVKPMPFWYKGNICLLGDAAHATTPNMGQGGAQAIEDAYYLSNIIANKHSNIFKTFQKIRMKKVNLIVKQSWLMGKMGHSKYFIGIRDFLLKTTPRYIFKTRWSAIYKLK